MNLRHAGPVFLGAFLLFALQPMAGKRILPLFGGGPAVWTTCMLLFQALLLAGYAYAHAIATRLPRRAQSRLHVAMLLLSLPLVIAIVRPSQWTSRGAESGDPVWSILGLLLGIIGLPYLLLATTSPLIQSWAAGSDDDVYRLYALSNVASFLALLSYPVAIEPWISVRLQFWLWSAGYLLYVALMIWSAASQDDSEPQSIPAAPLEWSRIFYWLALAACGSTMLIAATNQMCQEVAVIPFLWIVPLGLYLLTFTVCFDHQRWYDRRWWGLALALLLPLACALLVMGIGAPVEAHLLVDSMTLVTVCMICHGELASSKPAPEQLTHFYLTISAGGALGGVFVAVIAPRIFSDFTEFPLALAICALLAIDSLRRQGVFHRYSSQPLLTRAVVSGLAVGCGTALFLAVQGMSQGDLTRQRNFYGILRVANRGEGTWLKRQLTHGRTVHGFQYQDSWKRYWAVAYYGARSGLGLAMDHHPGRAEGNHLKIGVTGLGAGSIAVYGRSGDTIHFYEINPAVEPIAKQYFTYLSDSVAHIEVVTGDARLKLEAEPPQDYDLLVMDAFTSDAVPAHLLTKECAMIYRRHLKADGLLVFNISNRTLDLAPVVRALANQLGWRAALVTNGADTRFGMIPAEWVIVSNNQAFWNAPMTKELVTDWGPSERPPLAWTDDFTSLWRVLKF